MNNIKEILDDECIECMGIEARGCFEKNEEYGFCDVYVQAYNDFFHREADLKTEDLMKYHKMIGKVYDRQFKQ